MWGLRPLPGRQGMLGSGHAPKAGAKQPDSDAKPQVDETKVPSGETNEAASATNDETRTEAATGN